MTRLRKSSYECFYIEIVFKVVGTGTGLLSDAEKGDELEIVGPLGNGFEIDESTNHAVLVAGGMGIAPFPFLAQEIARKSSAPGKKTIFIGARSAKGIILADFFEETGFDVKIATDDGSKGFKGYVAEYLQSQIENIEQDKTTIYACGPEPMLKAVADLAHKRGIDCQVSLEERMACGVGACMSCVCRARDDQGEIHYERVCKEGPVFDSRKVIFDAN